MKDLFSALPSPPEPKALSARSRTTDIEAAIESQASEKGLVAHKPWIDKCVQLYTVSTVSQGKIFLNNYKYMCLVFYIYLVVSSLIHVYLLSAGIILVGPSASGKSTCVQALIDALCVNPRGLSKTSHSSRHNIPAQPADANHRLLKLNPCVVDDYQTMFGYLNNQNDWVDGIFTHTWRKANRVCMLCCMQAAVDEMGDVYFVIYCL